MNTLVCSVLSPAQRVKEVFREVTKGGISGGLGEASCGPQGVSRDFKRVSEGFRNTRGLSKHSRGVSDTFQCILEEFGGCKGLSGRFQGVSRDFSALFESCESFLEHFREFEKGFQSISVDFKRHQLNLSVIY